MCSKKSNYKKSEVVNIMSNLSKEMNVLYSNKVGGYSYFQNKSQTHYYGVRITEGLDTPDLHATLLCTWANTMILETMDELDENLKFLNLNNLSFFVIILFVFGRVFMGLNIFSLRLGEILMGLSSIILLLALSRDLLV